MNQSKSDKIRLLLNELAILNQPEIIGGSFYFNAESLLKIKGLSAELYLNADRLLPGNIKSPVAEIPEEKTLPVEADVVETIDLSVQPEITDDSTVTAEADTETFEALELESDETITADPEITQDTANEGSVVTDFVKPEEESTLNSQLEESNSPVNIFSGKISLTRKFEYLNNLFNSDEQAYVSFLNQISGSSDLNSALSIFQKVFEERGWKRKSETADDLKNLIRKNKL